MIIKISKSKWNTLSAQKQLKIAYNLESFRLVYPNIPQELAPKLIEIFNSIPKEKKGLVNYFNKLMRNTPKTEADVSRISSDISGQIGTGSPASLTSPELNQYSSQINQLTGNKEERIWIAKLIESKEINPNEDFPKIKLMLNSLQEYNASNPQKAQNISSFHNDKELHKFLNSMRKEVDFVMPSKGAEILANEDIDGTSVKLLKITDFNALTQVAQGANWCVLQKDVWNSSTYNDHQFYCFVIDGSAEVLIHKKTSQIKDTNDAPLFNLNIIKLIRHLVDKFDLNTNNADFNQYNDLLGKIEEFDANKHDHNWAKSYLEANPERISFWGKNDSINFVKYIYDPKILSKMDVSQVPKNILANIGEYNKFAKNDTSDALISLHSMQKGFVDEAGNINTKKYFKTVPDSVKNTTVSQVFKSVQEIEKGSISPDTSANTKQVISELLTKLSQSDSLMNLNMILTMFQILEKIK